MAKTLAQIITESRSLLGQKEESNSNFLDSTLTIWANDGVRRANIRLRRLRYTTSDLTVSAQAVTLNSGAIRIDQFRLKNPSTGKYELLEIKTMDELIALDPDYESATTGMPYIVAFDQGNSSVILYPPPSTAVKAQTKPLRTRGLEMPTAMSAGSDTPSLPENLHDLIPHWVAFRGYMELKDSEKATQNLIMWNQGIKDEKGASTELSAQANAWRFEEVD